MKLLSLVGVSGEGSANGKETGTGMEPGNVNGKGIRTENHSNYDRNFNYDTRERGLNEEEKQLNRQAKHVDKPR